MNFAEFTDFILADGSIAMITAGIAVFATIVTLAAPLLGSNKFSARIKAVATERERLRQASLAHIRANERGGRLRDTNKTFTRNIVDRLNLAKLLEDPKLEDKMMQAGLRGSRPVATFYFFRMTMPIVLFVGAGLYLFGVNDHGLSDIFKIAVCVAGAYIGYHLPGIYLSNLAQKRRESIMGAFPDALDLLLICVEAGMSIEAAFAKVASEIGPASIELAEELSLTTAELSYLQERRQAYENMGKRTNHSGVRAVATALIQAERYGTPLGSALRVMAKENRDMRLAAAEKKAASLPAKLTVPMILFFLPVLFVVILGPAIIRFQQMG